MKVIDLTHTIREDMPVYPAFGIPKPKLTVANDYEQSGFRETHLDMLSHTGTHIDAPAHLFLERPTLDELPAEQFIGKALVIDCRELSEGEAITMDIIRRYGEDLTVADFLLFNLGWDKRWGDESYFGDYPCIDGEVLDFIIAGGYRGIGFDVIGLDPISDESLTRHNKLLSSSDIINIENLKNLDLCPSGIFNFACLPLKFVGSDGAPARAVAWVDE